MLLHGFIDKRLKPPACETGYITLRNGSKYTVFVLQDALNALGYTGGGLDEFGSGTENSVRRFQRDQG